ncbi:hypothetical protein AB434_3449 [Heyndrickxia coagulans]|uniref:Uncharacterized protein n=1 Tax=Heyndrickxia coagulans TaxID=1398 RepID=A0AAN0T4I7_HEYCO|nr:hypothetical protein SB48_HM08orf02888 [Heyndrickxia coagulans]AKN55854.1 hypothetical protein AB434_3449 [Heyndrickxia coagulans]
MLTSMLPALLFQSSPIIVFDFLQPLFILKNSIDFQNGVMIR